MTLYVIITDIILLCVPLYAPAGKTIVSSVLETTTE